MDFKISLVKGLKALAFVLVGGLVTALVSPEFSEGAKALAEQLAGAVPVIGPALKGVFASALVGLVAGLAAALDNARKHWKD
jgi:hypothetical protein